MKLVIFIYPLSNSLNLFPAIRSLFRANFLSVPFRPLRTPPLVSFHRLLEPHLLFHSPILLLELLLRSRLFPQPLLLLSA